MRKVTLLLAALLCWSVSAMAQTPNIMNLHQTDGAVESVVLVTIENITFENNNMVISTSEGPSCFTSSGYAAPMSAMS